MKTKHPKKTSSKNEGEGNRTADRNYREGVQHHLKTHDVDREAHDAEKALEDPAQARELRDAEETARRHRK